MKTIGVTITCVLMLLALTGATQAKEWRGITPLHSTRADVERIIGQPIRVSGSEYDLKDEHVIILYTTCPCKKGRADGWNVPPETVLTITVSPKVEVRLADLRIDLSTYKAVKPQGHLEGVVYYVNEEEGVRIESREDVEIALSITYEPTAKDEQHFRCPKIVSSRRPPARSSSCAAQRSSNDN